MCHILCPSVPQGTLRMLPGLDYEGFCNEGEDAGVSLRCWFQLLRTYSDVGLLDSNFLRKLYINQPYRDHHFAICTCIKSPRSIPCTYTVSCASSVSRAGKSPAGNIILSTLNRWRFSWGCPDAGTLPSLFSVCHRCFEYRQVDRQVKT